MAWATSTTMEFSTIFTDITMAPATLMLMVVMADLATTLEADITPMLTNFSLLLSRYRVLCTAVLNK